MLSASEMFFDYPRRSRVGRANNDLGLESSSSEHSFHHNYNRRHQYSHHQGRHDSDGCELFQRSPHVRHLPCHRPSPVPLPLERAPVRLDQGTSQFVPSNSINTEILGSTSRPRLNGNERLPGAVLLAKARLLERLRRVSLSGNRRSGRSFGMHGREYTFGDDLRVVDAGDWGTNISTWQSARVSPSTNSTFQAETLQLAQDSYKKPAGLSPEALECLPSEVFSSLEKKLEVDVSPSSWDCSICLESFMEGDYLIRLPCEHRFHSICLDPWVRTCGDCPYCRKDIIVSSYKP